MAGMWYYSDKRQQKGPVSFEELRGLAQSGQIRPTDLVWQEGTRDWVRASLVDRLFDAAADPDAAPAWDEPGPRSRRRDEPDIDRPRRRDDEDMDRPRRRESARREEGMSSGLKIGLIIGGIALLLIVVAVVSIVVFSSGGGGENYTRTLFAGQIDDHTITCRAGQSVEVNVRTTLLDGFHADVDCEVFEPGRMVPIARDLGFRKDCNVRFIAARPGSYRVVVRNLGPGRARADVTIRR